MDRTTLSEEQRRRLDQYADLLRDPGIRRGVISRGDAERIRERHVDDALRGTALLRGIEVCDLGSGGGLPGVPLAIARPDLRVVLSEKRANRVDFLRLVVRTLGIGNAEVLPGDAGRLPSRSFDSCTARAFGDASISWATADGLLRGGGVLLYWAGASFDLASDVPHGVRAEVSEEGRVAGAGPLVIMSRQ